MLRTLKAEAPVYGGYVIGRDGKIIFVKGAIPGELVEVSLDEKKRDYWVASVKNVLEPSPHRRQPPCGIFGICGGCQLQFMEYERQISVKEEIIIDAMRRIGGMDVQMMPPMADGEFRYRQRSQFKISQGGEIGFYREGTREVIPIDECPVVADAINDALVKLKAIDLRGIRELHVIAGDTVAVLMKGNVPEDTAQAILDLGISGVALESGDSLGKDYITLDLNGLKYSLTPWSFFQAHWSLNRQVVKTVVDKLSPLDDKRILDLYSGAGNFSLPLSEGAKEVVAVEENRYAVEDGRRNAALNGIKNCNFIGMAVEDSIAARRSKKAVKLFEEVRYDVVVVDPPRPGLTSECLKKILETGSERVVYLSCNPATLARDLKKMREKYEIESIGLVDFFPNTYHIETLAFLRLK